MVGTMTATTFGTDRQTGRQDGAGFIRPFQKNL